jgi:VWFA-related protein
VVLPVTVPLPALRYPGIRLCLNAVVRYGPAPLPVRKVGSLLRYLSVVLITLLTSVALTAQEQKFEQKVDVNLVLVDVTVTDRTGNQILGLGPADFIVKEDGVAQKIESVDYFTNRRLLTAPEAQAAFKVERVREERNFILFFHKPLDSSYAPRFRSELLQARQAASKFIDDRMLASDRVAVAGFDARLKIFSDFTSDKAALKRALNDAIRFSDGLKSGSGPILSEINTRKMITRTGTVYDAIQMLSDAVQPILGRKVLMLFSPGIGEPSYFVTLQDEQRYYQPMIHALNRSNVSVYAAGMQVPFAGMEETLARMAIETGGEFYRDPVNYSIPLKEMEKDNSGYYLLSYYAPKPKEKHGYQKIDVALRNREFRVKSRDGYPY